MNKKSIFTGKEVKIGEGHDNIIMAIESSCDETACAIVKNGREVLSNVVASQIKTHEKYGGVIPEIAAREQVLGRRACRARGNGCGSRCRPRRRFGRPACKAQRRLGRLRKNPNFLGNLPPE